MTDDFTTWLRQRFAQAGHPADAADQHIRVARSIGFGPTELAYLAGITGASVEEIQERVRAERAQRAANGENDLESEPLYGLLKAVFPRGDL